MRPDMRCGCEEGRDCTKTTVCALQAAVEDARAEALDNGPWKLWFRDGVLVGVLSDDSTHDVGLRVDGDFADYDQRLAYCEWLRDRLNGEDV